MCVAANPVEMRKIDMMQPFFSVLVPVYNVKQYLDECVESLVGQSFQDYEVVLVNDGSTDGSGELCDAWRDRFPGQIRVFHQQNQGVTLTRARLFREAHGCYLVSADADDVLHTDALRILHDYISRYHADMVIFRASKNRNFSSSIREVPFRDGELLSIASSEELRRLFGATFELNALWMKAFRKDVAGLNRDFTSFSHIFEGEDLMFSLAAADQAERIVFCDRILYYYRENPVSITNTYKPKLFRSIRDVLRIQRSYAEKWDPTGELAKECDRNALRKFYDVIVGISLSGLPGNKKWALLREVVEDGDFLRCYAFRGTLEERKPRLTLLLAKNGWFAPLYLYGRLKRLGREMKK